MHSERTAILFRLGLLCALLALAWGCSTKPDAPAFDNPYDPNGTGPDPYELMATVQGDSVFLVWVDNPDVSEWAVFRSTTAADAGFEVIDPIRIVRVASGDAATAGDHDFAPSLTNWYRLQATLTSGELRTINMGEPAVITPPPLVRLAGGGNVSSTRFVTLEVRNDLGESVELSNTADFATVQTVDTVPGELETTSFTLPTVTELPATRWIHVRNRVSGSVGVADSVEVQLRFTPQLSILVGQRTGSDDVAVVVDTTLVLGVSGDGVIRARVSDSVAGLASATWDDSPDSVDWTLSASSIEPDTLFAEVDGDLGPTVQAQLRYTPAASVGMASLSVVDSAETTLDPVIQLVSVADGAGEMIFSEDPGFGGAVWTAFADTTEFTLSAGLGEKRIYARYRNAFDPVGSSATARVFLLGAP